MRDIGVADDDFGPAVAIHVAYKGAHTHAEWTDAAEGNIFMRDPFLALAADIFVPRVRHDQIHVAISSNVACAFGCDCAMHALPDDVLFPGLGWIGGNFVPDQAIGGFVCAFGSAERDDI